LPSKKKKIKEKRNQSEQKIKKMREKNKSYNVKILFKCQTKAKSQGGSVGGGNSRGGIPA